MEEVMVVIVGAGPSGLATSACLNMHSIPNIILERDDCYASLWKKRCYNRLKLHLGKQFCSLPYMPQPSSAPTFIPKDGFLNYLDDYVVKFGLNPKCCRSVESATYDHVEEKWLIRAVNIISNDIEMYKAKFLVVASGENSEAFIPDLPNLNCFKGEKVHSSQYKSGLKYAGKKVLVVGCGNSGMEIAFDLTNCGAKTSIIVRNPVHTVTKEMVYLGMNLLKFFSVSVVDKLIATLESYWYGDLTKYGLPRPKLGPFFVKARTGKSPVVDVGTVAKIKSGDIQVLPAIKTIEEEGMIGFENGEILDFDAIVFATGYKSSANTWLKDFNFILNCEGMPKHNFPSHWKGANGVYCAGLSQRGLAGVSKDAMTIADDIKNSITREKDNWPLN
ncbi:hypothetical protein Scep_019045 [Stephania cephalantha]|uniref:Flavin-containing monooxygenase n=1 Tax=Stephania cephalantha TaxID=152367 RepID=A0AAP0IB30_9MAGN